MSDLDNVLNMLRDKALAEPPTPGVTPFHAILIPEDTDGQGFSSIVKRCVYCKGTTEITLITAKYQRWRGGAHVQDVWPDMPIGDRETLISGTHSACFDAMFKEDEDEQG